MIFRYVLFRRHERRGQGHALPAVGEGILRFLGHILHFLGHAAFCFIKFAFRYDSGNLASLELYDDFAKFSEDFVMSIIQRYRYISALLRVVFEMLGNIRKSAKVRKERFKRETPNKRIILINIPIFVILFYIILFTVIVISAFPV